MVQNLTDPRLVVVVVVVVVVVDRITYHAQIIQTGTTSYRLPSR